MKCQVQIINQLQQPIIALDPNNHITLWNHGAMELYGYQKEEILGRHITSACSEEHNTTILKSLLEQLKIEDKQELVLQIKKLNKSTIAVRLLLSLIR